jgi:hypothetical protein
VGEVAALPPSHPLIFLKISGIITYLHWGEIVFVFEEKYTLDTPARNQKGGNCGKRRVIQAFLKEVESYLNELPNDQFSKGFGTRRVRISVRIRCNNDQ